MTTSEADEVMVFVKATEVMLGKDVEA